jgi:hypothetical protein
MLISAAVICVLIAATAIIVSAAGALRLAAAVEFLLLITAAVMLLISGAASTRLLIAAVTMLLIAAAGVLPMFLLAMGERAGESAGPVRRATFSAAAAGEGCRRSGGRMLERGAQTTHTDLPRPRGSKSSTRRRSRSGRNSAIASSPPRGPGGSFHQPITLA